MGIALQAAAAARRMRNTYISAPSHPHYHAGEAPKAYLMRFIMRFVLLVPRLVNAGEGLAAGLYR